jgi:hypothetical protein
LVAAAEPSINGNLDRGGGPASVPQQTNTAANPARSQALSRELNEDIRRIADSFGIDEDLELVCECEHGDCFARLPVSPDDYETVRRFPTRFLTKPEHVGPDDRIVHETARYVVVEKIGPSAETAILRDPRKRAPQRPAA